MNKLWCLIEVALFLPKFQTVIPESLLNGNTTTPHLEIEPGPEEPLNYDVINCAALRCPNNPPNLHGPPTEEPG
jgi:hypothetical protein